MTEISPDRHFALRKKRTAFPRALTALLAGVLLGPAPVVFAAPEPRDPAPAPAGPHAFVERTGTLPTEDRLKLRISADLGSVRVFTLGPGEAPAVRYLVRVETDVPEPLAEQLLAQYALAAKSTPGGVQITGALPPQSAHGRAAEAQFWVRFEVGVPRGYSVEVTTGAGDIETQDLGGTASLSTQGGNIRCGRIGGNGVRSASEGKVAARLETQGGHIRVLDVAGDLEASTGGGHINAGVIAGDAKLHSGGGHIHAAQISGRADLSTDGGNIAVGQAGNTVTVRTGGGQIDFGEVRGSVHAQTAGGGIRIAYVAGPMEVETSAGSICLTRVAGAVRAETAGGTITAFINPDAPAQGGAVRLAAASQLISGAGDILVYLPRNLAATIEATVESGGENRIQADPALALKMHREDTPGTGPVRASATLNGGGALLRLRTGMGKIRLQYLDADVVLRQSLLREQAERMQERLQEMQMETVARIEAARAATSAQAAAAEERETSGWFDAWMEAIEERVRGGVGEDPAELQKRASYVPPPAYPALAKQAGVQGIVRLQVRVGRDGHTEVLKILEGEPMLADAAIAAVQRWTYQPRLLNGRPVSVISEVTFNFQLR